MLTLSVQFCFQLWQFIVLCVGALVTFLWSAWLIKICEHRKTCIFCVLSLVKRQKYPEISLLAPGSPVNLAESHSQSLSHSWITPTRFTVSKYISHRAMKGCFWFLEAKLHSLELGSGASLIEAPYVYFLTTFLVVTLQASSSLRAFTSPFLGVILPLHT